MAERLENEQSSLFHSPTFPSLTVYEEQLETTFWRETENVFTLSQSCYYDVHGIGATPSFISVKKGSGGLFHCGVTTNFIFITTIHISMGGSPGNVREEPVSQFILQPFFRFSYVTSSSLNSPPSAHSPTFPSLHLRHSSFFNPFIALPSSQLILQLFRCSTYVTLHSPTLLSLFLCHKLFT